MRLSFVNFLENSVSLFGLTAILVDRFKSFDISCLVVSLGRLCALCVIIIVDYEHLIVIAAASFSQSIITSLLLLQQFYLLERNGIGILRWLLLPKMLFLNVLVKCFGQFDLTSLLVLCEDLLLALGLHHSFHFFF